MTYAYDDYVLMPTKDLYDTAVMKMAIEAAKDMYDKGQALMENFYKTYGDFMSPFAKDMERYGTVMNNVRKTVNDAYARGIDLFKSPEGRMLVSLLSHSIDPLWYNSARQNAKVGYAYLDAAAKLRAAGKYSEAQELFDIALNGGTRFGDFQTLGENGLLNMWNRPSPVEAISFQELVHPSFINIKPHLLSREEAISRVGAEYDPTYEYTGVTKTDMERAMRDNLPGLIGMPGYLYYKEVAKQQLQAAGISNPTEALINEQFVLNAVAADSQIMTPLSRSRSDYYNDRTLELKRKQLDIQERKQKMLEDKQNASKAELQNGWTKRLRAGIVYNGKKQLGINGSLGLNGLSVSDREKYAQNYSATQTRPVLGSLDYDTAKALFTGKTTAVEFDEGLKIKRQPVTFSPGSNLNFTAHRQYVYGGTSLTNGSSSNKLLKKMQEKRITGYMVHEDDLSVNNMYYSENASVWDINGYVRVKYDDIKELDKNIDNTLSLIGASKKTVKQAVGSVKGIKRYNDVTVVDIPVSRTIDSKAFSDSQIDLLSDQIAYTKTIAAKRLAGYEQNDIDEMTDYDE